MSANNNKQRRTYIPQLQLLLLFISGICTAPLVENEPRLEILENVYNEANPDDIDIQIDDDNNRNAVKSPYQLWPTRELPYKISSEYTDEEAEGVRAALRYFNEETCLRFSEYDDERDAGKRYLYYKKSDNMCGTRVGYNRQTPKGPHDIVMNPYCLARRGVIQHETMHVLGLYHEQSRPDRNDYVNIEYSNIPLRYWSQFTQYPESMSTTYGVPYDYLSVMHYSQNAFARDPKKPTMRAKEDGNFVEREMGQVEGPSVGDLTKLRMMYKCNEE